MMDLVLAILVAILLVGGGIFTLLAAVGVLRLPDIYTRMHAASKAGTVGSGLMLLAAGLHATDITVFFRTIVGFVFFVLTAPIAAHLLAKAAHNSGHKPARLTVIDALARATFRSVKKP